MMSFEDVMQDPSNRAAVIANAQNLAICYNNAKDFKEANGIFTRILSFDPEDIDALVGSARYQQHLGRQAGDSARVARESGSEKGASDWHAVRDQHFDSARVLLKQAYEIKNDNCGLAAEYGLMAAILQRYDEAKPAFVRATELCPDDVDHWISLGDCNLTLQDFPDAAASYEKVIEFDPNNKAVLERLADLYLELKNPTRRAEIQKKLDSM
jgi:tetratricopeptide (TPR) repeat protein